MDQKKITNIEVKKKNRNDVFRYICKHSMASNPDISYALKLSLPTVTQITRELIGEGLVEEKGALESTGGRRAKALAVSDTAGKAAGLDITKNHISLMLTGVTGEILKYERIFLPYAAEGRYYEEVSQKLEYFLEEGGCGKKDMLGIGISFPGIIDLDRELIADSHVLGVSNLPFSSVSCFFDYPCHFLNDANAGAYAEGIQSECMERFFYLSLSGTVGGAVYSSGRLEQGSHFRCGEAGHMTIVPDGEACYCGKNGCLDAYCSAKRLTDGKLEDFFERLGQGEREAASRWEQYTSYLAVAVNNIHMILDCDVVLGGYVGSCMGEYIRDVRSKVSQRNTFAKDSSFVRPCSHKMGAAALGASRKVIELFLEQV
ncbi:MAG: ROK family protein [Eubacterium sp.]|nr:ROK family protein [Eubacterium sp.]